MNTPNAARSTLLLSIIAALALSATAQVLPKKGSPTPRIYGLTVENLDSLNVDDFEQKFHDFTFPIVLRVVFQPNSKPSDYEEKLKALHNPPQGKKNFYIVALPFDSDALRKYHLSPKPNENYDCRKFKGKDRVYDHKAKCFVEYFQGARDYIDAWEIGNEVNGEWADESYKKDLPPSTKGSPLITIEKINRLSLLIPANKPQMLTVSYFPNCVEWTANAMDQWINNFPKPLVDRIDYVLVSYYENNCRFHTLNDEEMNNNVFGVLRTVFTTQFVGMGEIGYSDGEGENFQNCAGDDTCYCSKDMKNCNGVNCIARGDKMACCRKSKVSQMQRYYGMKPADPQYVGGGYWWNAGNDYKVPAFRDALIKEFNCLATGQQCEPPLPADCR